ncbi:MAG TPA: hypothetical protein VGM92_02090, partial [Candidatus Kapabacteria bacterium]
KDVVAHEFQNSIELAVFHEIGFTRVLCGGVTITRNNIPFPFFRYGSQILDIPIPMIERFGI